MKVILNHAHKLNHFGDSSKIIREVMEVGLPDPVVLDLDDTIIFPGLVNAHDHLDFNLFPFLGDGPYESYVDWSADIHQKHKDQIDAALQIPRDLRIKWGILKNLIAGVTSVIHHGTFDPLIRSIDYPVYLNYQYLHALETEPFWRLKLFASWKKKIMIHIGEGKRASDSQAIDRLTSGNICNRDLIGIHGISMNEDQSKNFKAMVWCPESNLKLYGKTADVATLKKQTTILFGTDSTLTSSFNVFDQIRLARSLKVLSDEELFNSLTHQPKNIFTDMESSGIVIAKRKSKEIPEAFFSLNPEDILMVIVRNKILLLDLSIMKTQFQDYQLINVGDSVKWMPSYLAEAVRKVESRGIKLPMEISTYA